MSENEAGNTHLCALVQTANEQDASAELAGLLYVSDAQPGIRTLGDAGAFTYKNRDGKRMRDPAVLARIRALAIPPAYEDVWICTEPCRHIQATGRDARGRKQYRYHALWRKVRDSGKFDRVASFAESLPKLRRALRRDIVLQGLPREKILAAVVALISQVPQFAARVSRSDRAALNEVNDLAASCRH